MRFDNPNTKILMAKHDLDSAYRRIHWRIQLATLCITIIDSIAYLLTRLAFGISSGSSEYSLISDMVVDYANILINDDTWDTKKNKSTNQHLFGNTEYLKEDTKTETTKELEVTISQKEAYVDGYIDNLITIVLDKPNLRQRGDNAVPLLVHTLFRPLAKDEPIERADPL